MGIIRALVVVSLAAGAVLLDARPLFACDCHGGGPVCEDFWKTPAVFVGRVEAVKAIRNQGSSGPDERVRFTVTETLRGTTAREIEIFNYFDNCDFRFAPDQEWVIYAFRRESSEGLTTSICTRSAPLRAAAEDLAYGRAALLRSADKGRIFGQLTSSHKSGDIAAPGIRISLAGLRSEPISALTDEYGRYEILAPAGSYRLTAALPAGMTVRSGGGSVELPDNRACVVADLRADKGAEPLYPFAGRTTTKSAVRRVEIEGGSQRAAGDLILPEATRTAQITGIVVHADGRPAAGVKVRTKAAFDSTSFPWTTIRTDSRGAFSFALVIGMRYRLVAEPVNGVGKIAELTLDSSANPAPRAEQSAVPRSAPGH
jgi:hypothetical protein